MSRTSRKGNATLKNFIAHPRELRESPAWQGLPDNARRVLDRLELEHMRHGGSENGKLVCTYTDFEKAGLRRKSISLAIRQCVALGFLEITRRGGRSISDVRPPSLYRLTYVYGRKENMPTDEWKAIKTEDDALLALHSAASKVHQNGNAGTENAKKPGAKTPLRGGAKTPLQENGEPGAKTPLLA